MSVVSNNILAGASGQGATGYEIERSLRFNSGDSAHLSRQPSSAGNLKTWTYAFWMKRTSFPTDGTQDGYIFNSSDTGNNNHSMMRLQGQGVHKLHLYLYEFSASYGAWDIKTSRVYRDPSAWYHIVIAMDTTQATAADRVKIYTNGVRETEFDSSNYPAQNANAGQWNSGFPQSIGKPTYGGGTLNAYLADVHFIDGQALAPTDFGETDDNGVWQPKKFAGTYGTNGFHLDFSDNSSNAALGTDTSGNNNTWTVNNLVAAPSGLSTANQGFEAVTYSGTGGTQSISSLAFQPDFVWIKNRTGANNHLLSDVIRGATKFLRSDTTDAEATNTTTLTSFDSNGFTVGNNAKTGASGSTYVAWCWKAGGAAVSNTDGTITSQVSANNTYGFSIAKYTGTGSNASFGHGLSSAPNFIIVKKLTAASWNVYHTDIGATKILELNDSGAETPTSSWNSTAPTSSVVSVGNYPDTNDNGGEYIAYCWSEVAGFSKFGTYTGNGSTNGPTVTLGFKPRYIILRSVSASRSWCIYDTARDANATNDNNLFANNANAESSDPLHNITILNDGFKLATGNVDRNGNGEKFVYAAFAGKPDGTVVDSLIDTPTNATTPTDTGAGGEVVGNYATLNPLITAATTTLSNGNLDMNGYTPYSSLYGTIGISSGKYYWETTYPDNGGMTGVAATPNGSQYPGQASDSYAVDSSSKYNNNASSAFHTFAPGSVVGCAFDADNGTLTYYDDGVSAGTAFTSIPAGTYLPIFRNGSSANVSVNFGQRPFAYTAPSGYKALCTANLPDPTIEDGSQYFDTKLYTGTGSALSITMDNSSMSPDFVWLKARNDGADHHHLFDTVRGAGKRIFSNLTNAESTDNNTLSSFDSNGFSLGTQTAVNGSGDSMVGWVWDAGDSNTTIAAGSLNSSAYNQSQDFYGSGTASGSWEGTYDWEGVFNSSDVTTLGSVDSMATTGTTTFTFGSAVSVSSTVTLYIRSDSGTTNITLNDGLSTSISATAPQNSNVAPFNISFNGNLSNIKVSYNGSQNYFYISGVAVDSKILVNSGVTPTNVPSIASTVRANPSAGFSIVSYTGSGSAATIGHGLNVTPSLIILKRRDQASSSLGWVVLSYLNGALKYGRLDGNGALATAGEPDPTSSVFSVLTNADINANNGTYIAYCFAPVEQYSSFGSFLGNGSADGPFVFTGFQPKLVGWKNADAAHGWYFYDDTREPNNPHNDYIELNSANAEGSNGGTMDILSNGFKVRNTGADMNANGNKIIYIAFAENPFKIARAR